MLQARQEGLSYGLSERFCLGFLLAAFFSIEFGFPLLDQPPGIRSNPLQRTGQMVLYVFGRSYLSGWQVVLMNADRGVFW